MIFYHGTTLDAARAIQREGLIPHRQTAYRLLDDNGESLRDMPGENKPYTYLQTDKNIALGYAQFRTNYERASNGQKVTVSGLLVDMWKDTDEQNPQAKPALITFDLPSTITRKLRRDPQNWQGGKVCLCVIPPKYIRSIQEVP